MTSFFLDPGDWSGSRQQPLLKGMLAAIALLTTPVVGMRRNPSQISWSQLSSEEVANSRTDFVVPGSILARSFQWNSDKSDLTAETLAIFGDRSDADLVVTCMTEANPKKGIHEILVDNGLSADWAHIAYGRHTGMTGVNARNAQILSVFFRKPAGNSSKYVAEGGRIEWISGIGWGLAGMMRDELMAPAAIPGVLSTKTRIHQTSNTGKGGVSAMLSFHATDQMKATTVAVMCGHMDSESRDERRDNVIQMMEEVAIWSPLKGPHDRVRQSPCKVWDSKRGECPGEADDALFNRQHVDAVLLLGDLNFRFHYRKEDGTVIPFPQDMNLPDAGKAEMSMEQLVSEAGGRQAMFLEDPLNPKRTTAEALVQDSPHGFAFQCNDPSYTLPSYKRNKPRTCAQLASKLRDCGSLGGEAALDKLRYAEWREQLKEWQTAAGIKHNGGCSKEEIQRLTGECFKDKEKGWKQKEKGRYVQLGWLDRLCFRAVDAPVAFDILEEVPWDEHPFGDHAPVELVLSLANPKDVCKVAPHSGDSSHPVITATGVSKQLHWQREASIHAGKASAVATCPQDMRLNIVAQGASTAKPVRELPLSCEKGTLSAADGTPVTALACLKYCGPLEAPESVRLDAPKGVRDWTAVSAVDHPLGALYVEGSSVKLHCPLSYELSGPGTLVCGANGKYTETKDLKCLRTCSHLSAVLRKVGEYGKVNLERAGANHFQRTDIPAIPVQGDRYVIQCNEIHSSRLEKSLTCLPTGLLDGPIPKCLAKCGAPVLGINLRAEVHKPASKNQARKEQVFPWGSGVEVFEGYTIKYSCGGKSALSGFDTARCDRDGAYHAEPGLNRPKCVGFCAVPDLPADSGLSITGGKENRVAGMTSKDVVEGTQLQYSCKSGCVQLGGTMINSLLASITCQSNSKFDQEPPRCICGLKLEIKSIDFGNMQSQKDKTDLIKIKLFPYRLAGKIETEPKGYARSRANVDPADLPTTLHMKHDLNTYFLHIEMCDRSYKRWLTGHASRCESLARSEEPPLKMVEPSNSETDASHGGSDEDDDDEDIPTDCPLCLGTLARNFFAAGKNSLEVAVPMHGVGITKGVAKVSIAFAAD